MHTDRIRSASPSLTFVLLAGLVLALLVTGMPGAHAGAPARPGEAEAGQAHPAARFATFNASLHRLAEGQLVADLATGDAQARVIAEIIQRNRPDVILLNEFDYDARGEALDLFHDDYLAVAQHADVDPLHYPYRMAFPSNTGMPSGFDLNRDDRVDEAGDDALGFGLYPGQYAFAVLSRYPILEDRIRTFQEFRWVDMPGALLPDDPGTPAPADWYFADILEIFRLSSKNHVDVPVRIGRDVIHLLASHPTPPAFDGPEQRNVLRNSDEIRFWADYVTPGRASDYIYDDDGRTGGLHPGARFVIAGDLNADPCDGDSVPGAGIHQLLGHPRVRTSPTPDSEGAVEQALAEGRANLEHCNPHAHDTADFSPSLGNLRVDYLLPSRGLRVTDAQVFWPTGDEEVFDRLIGTYPFPGSDHRLVRIDVRLPVGGPR